MTQIIGARYFYQVAAQKVEGPVNKLEMRALMRKKIVEPETMVVCPATQAWYPCERFLELPKPAYNKLLLCLDHPVLVATRCDQADVVSASHQNGAVLPQPLSPVQAKYWLVRAAAG